MIDTDKYEGHHICVECGSDEIPINTIDSGETGLTDYFFSCSQCDFSWYVAVRTDEHEDGASAGIDYVGFMDEDGNIHWTPRPLNVKGEPNPAHEMIDTDKYEGHQVSEFKTSVAGPRHSWVTHQHELGAKDAMFVKHATAALIADAPDLLAEVERLREALTAIAKQPEGRAIMDCYPRSHEGIILKEMWKNEQEDY